MRCVFTGHRPEKLPWGDDETDLRAVALKIRITQAIGRAYARGYRIFACGMARGCDLYFFDCVLGFSVTHPDVEIEAWLPCPEQCVGWSASSRQRYLEALKRCHRVYTVETSYSPGCMIRRNRAMIDQAELVISVYDGSGGGTGSAVEYAFRTGVPVEALWR